MKNLLKKELLLSLHPTAPMFLLLSAMLLIPNYPYYVVFFYTGLAVFFTCLLGRENNDVYYTLSLPVAKKAVVQGRFACVVLLELLQLAIAVPFAFLRQKMPVGPNMVGMDANIALFGFAFLMLGIFNSVFFYIYYKDVQKVGSAFVWSSVAVFLYILLAETAAHVIPFVKNYLDTPDPLHLPQKMIVLTIGALLYGLLTYMVYQKSIKHFEAYDL